MRFTDSKETVGETRNKIIDENSKYKLKWRIKLPGCVDTVSGCVINHWQALKIWMRREEKKEMTWIKTNHDFRNWIWWQNRVFGVWCMTCVSIKESVQMDICLLNRAWILGKMMESSFKITEFIFTLQRHLTRTSTMRWHNQNLQWRIDINRNMADNLLFKSKMITSSKWTKTLKLKI